MSKSMAFAKISKHTDVKQLLAMKLARAGTDPAKSHPMSGIFSTEDEKESVLGEETPFQDDGQSDSSHLAEANTTTTDASPAGAGSITTEAAATPAPTDASTTPVQTQADDRQMEAGLAALLLLGLAGGGGGGGGGGNPTPANNPPTITSNGGGATAAISVAENSTAVTTVTASDADAGAVLTYSLSGTDAALFNIAPSTGVLTFVAAPDFEAPADAGSDNVYDVTVQVSDGTNTDSQAIAITVTNINEFAPAISSNGGGATASVNVAENSTAVTTVTASDADAGAVLTYSLSGTDAALFNIAPSTGVLTFVAAPDFEAPADAGGNNVYDVTVQVSDGVNSDSQAIAVTVSNVNEFAPVTNDNIFAPVIRSNGGGATAALSVAENSTAVTTATASDADAGAVLTYSLSGTDAALFNINPSTGVLTFVAAPNFEAPADAGGNNVYDVTLRVSDGVNSDTQAIAVTVSNVNEFAPVITTNGGGATAALSVAENSTAVTTATASDADAGAVLTYSLSGTDAALFNIDPSTGVLAFVAAPDFEAPADTGGNNVYDVTVQVSDGVNSDTQAIAVTVTDVAEDTTAPSLTTSSPADNATGVAIGSNIVLTFSENVVAGSGNIVISNGGGDTRTIAVGDASQVTISGATVTLNPTSDLIAGSTYNVQMAAGVLLDAAGNPYAGIATATTLNFTTTAIPIDLSTIAAGTGGFVINGQGGNDWSGWSVASAGDVNGDGLDDLIVGAPGNSGYSDGHSYVVFGKSTASAIDLSSVAAGSGGFVINAQAANDRLGHSVASAGDVNGDGLSDLVVGAFASDPAAAGGAGRSYVVFGKSTTTAVNLSAIAAGSVGFVINGQCGDDWSGWSVASAGDVNGDGLADLIVGARNSDPAGVTMAGRSYVVFGQTATGPIELSAIAAGSGGFVINGQCVYDQLGWSVDSAGDVNGDGFADLIVGAWRSALGAGPYSGRSYVVFGKASTGPIDVSAIAAGTGGFVINGQSAGDLSGHSVASAGDVNGDGLADLIIGAYSSDPAGLSNAGRSYVVFGKASNSASDLSAIAAGTGGFVINGQCAGDYSGHSVASAGDVNGDGLADLIVGAPRSDPAAGADAGRSYVVFGQTATSPIDLSAVAAGSGGFVINGQAADDFSGGASRSGSGQSVASAGDVNGDGLADLIVGAHRSDPAAGGDAGRSYVIFGSTSGTFVQTAVDQLGTGGSDTLTGSAVAETLVGGPGDDTLIGNGGADVLYGGAGDDSIVVNAGNISALAAGVTGGQLARIDGGSGIDTFSFADAGINLDLTAIANQGGGAPGSASRIESIERIDLTGSGDNTLTLGLSDVLDMAGMNSFNNANGWADGTYDLAAGGANGANPEQRHQLVIDGNAGDVVNFSDWGASVGTVTNDGHTYLVYNQGLYAQLLIDQLITQSAR